MSPTLEWGLVALFALVQVGVVLGTIHLAKVLVDRSVRRGFAPLHAQLAAYRERRAHA